MLFNVTDLHVVVLSFFFFFLFFVHVHTKWIPECNPLPFKHPHLMGESGDEWRLAEELLLGDGPEVSSGQVLR